MATIPGPEDDASRRRRAWACGCLAVGLLLTTLVSFFSAVVTFSERMPDAEMKADLERGYDIPALAADALIGMGFAAGLALVLAAALAVSSRKRAVALIALVVAAVAVAGVMRDERLLEEQAHRVWGPPMFP